MRWQLLKSIHSLVPGERIAGVASTAFPDELFADHFPSFPVTPGVLGVEMGAQLAGLLVLATVMEQRGHWVFPVLARIRDARFYAFIPPRVEVACEATLDSLRPEAALCDATLSVDGKRCVRLSLMLAFDPDGHPPEADEALLRSWSLERLEALGSPWRPSTPGGGRT